MIKWKYKIWILISEIKNERKMTKKGNGQSSIKKKKKEKKKEKTMKRTPNLHLKLLL